MISKDITKDLQNLSDLFDFSNLNKASELFSNKNEKALGKLNIESPKNLLIGEFICFGSKAYSFKCGSGN